MEARKLVVLFGSQTGTAHDVADRVTREAKRRHFAVRTMPMDEYVLPSLIQEPLVVFVCSTTGQGDPPDNMKMFWKFLLRRDLPTNSLSNLQFAVLALGDSSYQKFNVVGKRLQKRLQQLGGEAIHSLGLADDQHDLGVDAVVSPWLNQLWEKVLQVYPLPPGLEVISADVCPPPKYKAIFLDSSQTKTESPESNDVDPIIVNNSKGLENTQHISAPSQLCPFHAHLLSNRRVTDPAHFQDVRLVKLDITHSGIRYSPGDVAMIHPQNSADTVQQFLNLICVDPDAKLELRQNDPETPLPVNIPSPVTPRWLCTHYWDINSVPRRSFFELLRYHAGGEPDSDAEMEREKLTEFCSPEGQEELYNYCNRVRRNIREVLLDFTKTCAQLQFDYLFDLIPPLQSRAFSIASSPTAHPNELHLLMAVVKYQTKLHLPRMGVCSTWIAGLEPETSQHHDSSDSKESVSNSDSRFRVPVWVKGGTIRFPTDKAVPLVMVGPGTGLAPFRSVIHERCQDNAGGLVLFFGCRSESKDYFCKDDWTSFVERGLLKVFTAFSRDQDEKVYVQHKLREQGDLVWNLIHEQNAYFYIAGNAKSMPDDVKEALTDVIVQHGCLSQNEAELYIQQMEKSRRFQVEAWS